MEWQEVTAEPGRGLSEFNRDPGCRGVTARDGTGLKTHELQSGDPVQRGSAEIRESGASPSQGPSTGNGMARNAIRA